MSRFLELKVDGTTERVAERAGRAFRSVGKIEEADENHLEGMIKIDGEPAYVTVKWLESKNNRILLDVSASSDDRLSQAADSAMYRFASAYKAVGWPGSEKDLALQREQRLARIKLIATVSLVVVIIGLYIVSKLTR